MMDSPTRDLLETLEHADRELEKMEKHQEEYERNWKLLTPVLRTVRI